MTIDEIGSLGELIAAVATVLTLAYLALQIRQSNRSHELSAIARIGESTETWLSQVVQDPVLLDLYLRGLSDPGTLERAEKARFNLLILQFLRSTETGWIQANWGLVDSDYWSGFRETIRFIVGSGAGRRAFELNRAILHKRFAAEVDEIIGAAPADAL